jgi:hypothetical protein
MTYHINHPAKNYATYNDIDTYQQVGKSKSFFIIHGSFLSTYFDGGMVGWHHTPFDN